MNKKLLASLSFRIWRDAVCGMHHIRSEVHANGFTFSEEIVSVERGSRDLRKKPQGIRSVIATASDGGKVPNQGS